MRLKLGCNVHVDMMVVLIFYVKLQEGPQAEVSTLKSMYTLPTRSHLGRMASYSLTMAVRSPGCVGKCEIKVRLGPSAVVAGPHRV